MVLSFDRPTGAPADVAELEYVSALHQTALPHARANGSIDANDVRYYLRSRFGVEVTVETVRNQILHGLGGSNKPGEVIDLMELTAILLIPYLCKAATIERGEPLPEGMVKPERHVMKHVSEMIVHDVFLDEKFHSTDEAPLLTPDLLRRVLTSYGEADLAADDKLIESMMEQVGGHDRFDAAALLTGCSADVRLYDISAEVRYATTYETVMGETSGGPKKSSDDSNDTVELDQEAESNPPEYKHVYSAPAIDTTADAFWSKSKTETPTVDPQSRFPPFI